jgi:hypothetical protein
LEQTDLDLRRALASELTAAGIVASDAEKHLVSSRIFSRGRELIDDLRGEFDGVRVPFREKLVLGLGVGAALSDFATAEVPLTPECRRALSCLGGLMIVIVSAYDKVLDSGRPPPAVCFSAVPPCRPHAAESLEALLPSLQAEYFRRLDNLPRKQPALRSMADTVIRRMYAAELQSVAASPVGRSTWWRKNVLPILMLGLPAWIAADSFSSPSCIRHLMWLARLGEFFGWLDDCVDYVEDVRLGQANRIDARLRSISKEQIVRTIAAQGTRVLARWDRENLGSPLRSTFSVIVWSWIENSPSQMVS